jgi:hypothetical protein
MFGSNSAAICACPHVGFSDAILRINALVSAGTAGLPVGRDFHLQNNRNAFRYQPMKVAGFTTFKTGCQSNRWDNRIKQSRTGLLSRRGRTPRSS